MDMKAGLSIEDYVKERRCFLNVLVTHPGRRVERKENQRRGIENGKYRKLVHQQKKETAIFWAHTEEQRC